MTHTVQTESNPAGAAVAILIVIALAFFWLRGFKAMSARMAGWSNLVRQFPAPEIERLGDTFKNMTGWIGRTEFKRSFTLQLIQEGLLIRPFFAVRSPVLIPWPKISEVQVSEGLFLGRKQYYLLKIEYDKLVQFALPPEVLPTVEKNISADRFRKVKTPGSIGEVFKERWKNRKT